MTRSRSKNKFNEKNSENTWEKIKKLLLEPITQVKKRIFEELKP